MQNRYNTLILQHFNNHFGLDLPIKSIYKNYIKLYNQPLFRNSIDEAKAEHFGNLIQYIVLKRNLCCELVMMSEILHI